MKIPTRHCNCRRYEMISRVLHQRHRKQNRNLDMPSELRYSCAWLGITALQSACLSHDTKQHPDVVCDGGKAGSGCGGSRGGGSESGDDGGGEEGGSALLAAVYPSVWVVTGSCCCSSAALVCISSDICLRRSISAASWLFFFKVRMSSLVTFRIRFFMQSAFLC